MKGLFLIMSFVLALLFERQIRGYMSYMYITCKPNECQVVDVYESVRIYLAWIFAVCLGSAGFFYGSADVTRDKYSTFLNALWAMGWGISTGAVAGLTAHFTVPLALLIVYLYELHIAIRSNFTL
jgi:hypothetical protein